MAKRRIIRNISAQDGGRSRGQADAIRRYFREMPVVEAAENLRVFINSLDIKKARKKDPSHCVYANACRRLYGSCAILFFRSVAYVDLPDENGNRIVNRFILRSAVRKQIVKFDKTRKAAPGGFLLSAPSPSETLHDMHIKQKQYQRRRAHGVPVDQAKRRAYLKGRAVMAALGTDIRNGSGMVQFR